MHYFANNFHDELIAGAEQVKKNNEEHWHYCLTETKIFSCLFLWGEGALTNTPKTFFQHRHLTRELKIIHWATMFDFGFERLGWGEGTCKKHFLFLLPSLSFFHLSPTLLGKVSLSQNPLWRILSALHTLWDLGQLVLVWLTSCKGFISFSFHTVWSYFFLFFWGEGTGPLSQTDLKVLPCSLIHMLQREGKYCFDKPGHSGPCNQPF